MTADDDAAMAPGAAKRRPRESGQALILALLALLLASIGAAFVAEDIALRERALRDEMIRARLRGLVDAAMADALGRLGDHLSPVEEEVYGGGRIGGSRELVGSEGAIVRVWASYAGRRVAAVANVHLPMSGPPEVLLWQRLPAATGGPE